MVDLKKQIIGKRSRASGERFEMLMAAACDFYHDKGYAVIEKTPEPMKPLRPYGTGDQDSLLPVIPDRPNRILKAPCVMGVVLFLMLSTQKKTGYTRTL